MQSQSVEFSKLINFLLLMSKFALWTCKISHQIIIFADGTIFASRNKVLSCFSFTTKNVISLMVVSGKVFTLNNFLLHILYSHKPDKIESPIIKVVSFFQVDCLLVIPGSIKSPEVV